ncbi:GA module [Gardnerella sp. DNF00497B]|uniref:GA module n=1 Tax=Gardnerella sp. DNF00497B TaxID=2749048 RepID=UPI003BB03ABB
MVKKTQAAKNALHVSKNYAYLKPSTLRSMAKEISGTRLEACKSYAVSRLPKIAVTATLASLLACGAGLPTHQAWANGFNLPDGSYRYANRDSSAKVQKYVDINAVPCDKNKETDKDKADRATFGQYYKVEYQFNSHGEWWGGRPFWWASVPKDVTIVDDSITLYKDEELTGGSASQKTGTQYTKATWDRSVSRFWFDNNKEQGAEFKSNWERMTGEAGGYDKSGNTLGTSREYKNATSALIINWESRGNRRSKISFVIKLNNKTEPLKFAAGVYQVLGNWHYTVGKVALAPTLPEYSKELELTYPKDKVEVDSSKYGKNLAQDEKNNVLTKLWEANKNNADVLKKLKDMPEVPTEEAFKKAVKVNNDGSATVTYKDNSTDTIFKENLTKRYVPLSERTKITYPALTSVKNPTALDQSEKKQVEDAIKNANKDKNIKSVTVDANGKATITFDDKIGTPSTKTIEGKYLVKKQRSLADKFTPYYPVPMAVGNPQGLTQGEQTELVKKVYEANKTKADFIDAIGKPNNLEEAKKSITVDNKGNVTITYTDKSTDKLDGGKLVYQAKKLNETTYITLPARTPVQDAKKIQEKEQSTIRQAILTANNELQSKLKGKNENSAITFDDNTHTMTVKFNDDSTSTFDYSELVYTKGNPENPTMQNASRNGYKYNITKIAVKDKSKLTSDDWHKFVRKFVQDNWEANQGQTAITDRFINGTSGLLDKLNTTGDNIGNGMQLYKYKDKWHTKSGSNLTLSNGNFGQNGIVSIYQGNSIEIKKNGNFGQETAFMLSADDCFVSDSAAPNPKELKKEANDLIDKILKKNGLNDQEIKKFKEDHQGEINNITKPEDVDKIIKSADKHGKDEKKKKDAQQQINDAKNNLGLTPEQKTELDKKIGNETDPEKIREKINEFQKDQDQKKQEEHNKQQQQADQQAEQEKQQQQQKDDAKVDTDIQTQNQQEHQDAGKAEEAKKTAELEKQKQAAINEINGNDKLKPEEKEQFIKQVSEAQNAEDVKKAKDDATLKGNQNQAAADSNNNNGLDAAKAAAKDKISKLNNLSEQDKQKYQGEIGNAGNLDKVAEILNNAEFEDAKAAAKKKIAELKQNGDLTDQEAMNFNTKLDDKNTDSIQDIDSILQEVELAKTRKDANAAIDSLKNLNNAQKKALKEEVANPETNPQSNLDTIEKVKTAITAVVTKAKELDGKMKSLKDLVTLVNGQKSTLIAKPDYKDDKKTAFDTALTNASTLVDLTNGTNADGAKVDEIKKALEKAVQDLGGKTVDKSALQTLINNDADFKKTIAYINADQTKKITYNEAIADGNAVLTDANATAEKVAQAVDAINSAKAALDGKVNITGLEQKVAEAKKLKKSTNPQSAGDAKYENASEAKKQAVDTALQQAESALADAKSTATQKPGEAAKTPEQKQKAVNDALTQLTNAINELDGVDTQALQDEVTKDNALKNNAKCKNASETKKSAFNTALGNAQAALNEATRKTQSTKTREQKQKAVNDALTALKQAVQNLDGNDVSELQTAITNAKAKQQEVVYKNGTSAKKKALDDALKTAEDLVKTPHGHTDPEISTALNNLNTAINGLDGTVNTAELQTAVDNAKKLTGVTTPKSQDAYKYENASEAKKQAIDSALQQAESALANAKSTATQKPGEAAKTPEEKQKAVNDALTQLTNAINALDGNDKTQLVTKLTEAKDKKNDVSYKNASTEKQAALDDAIASAEGIVKKAGATADEITRAITALKNAVTGLDGHDASGLQAAVTDAESKKKTVAYTNASDTKKTAFDQALQTAQTILAKKGATEKEISDATTALKNASNALNGTVDTSKLQAEVDKADSLKKSVQYTNAVQDKKSAYDTALTNAESALADAENAQSANTPDQKQTAVNVALLRLQTAAAALNGVDITDLQAEIALENSVKESVKYAYDTAEKQQTYNKALQDAKELISKLADPAGKGVDLAAKSQSDRQALVNTALKNLKNAKDALNGVNKTVLQAEVDDDSHFSKSFAYLLGEAPDLDVYKKALAEAKRVLADPNATQAQVDAALKDLQAAKNSIANKYNGAGTGNIGSGSGTGNAGTGNAGTGNAGTGNTGTGDTGSGSEAGYGVNDNAPTTVDKGELNIQIQGAESDSQPGNAGNGNAGAGANTGNSANVAGKAGAGANSGNAGNAANTNAANANANNANGANSAAMNAAVENNPAVKQADAQVAKAQAALDAALAEAKKVAADPNATQAQVDAAVQNLSAARKALAAAKAHAADVRASVRAQVLKSGSVAQLSKTGSDVSVFGLFAATLSAAGAALFSAKRRGTSRHSNK